jgi:hypothetical protein
MLKVPVSAILPISLLISSPQKRTLHTRQHKNHKTSTTTDPHPLPIVRLIRLRENIRPQDRSTLPERSQNSQCASPLAVSGMRVPYPSQSHGNRDEDLRRQEQPKVAYSDGLAGREEDVADSCNQARTCDKGATDVEFVAEECDCNDHDPAKEVWGSGQAVALNSSEGSHLRNDGWYEERERCEADVDAEVD